MTEPAVQEAESVKPLEGTIAAMARIVACHSPSFSPDGQRLAFISNLSGLPQLWTVDARGGWPELLTGGSDPVVAVAYSPTGRGLAFAVAPGGGLNQQIYVMR